MVNGERRNVFLQQALQYAELGYRVFPCSQNTKLPLSGSNGFKDATTDTATIEEWWNRNPNANVAIHALGLVIIDLDKGNQWLKDTPTLREDLNAAKQAQTPRGGYHYWFKQPPGRSWTKTEGTEQNVANGRCLALKVDTRANDSYAVVYPSCVDGRFYQWIDFLDCPPDELPEPPEWLTNELDRIQSNKGKSARRERVAGEVVESGDIIEGGRNSTLVSIGGKLRRDGSCYEEIEAHLLATNAFRCKPPLSVREVKQVALSVSRYEPDQVAQAAAEGWYEQDRKQPEEKKTVSVTQKRDAQIPSKLLKVPGLISEIAAYTNATSFRYQPDLAFAGALSLMAVLTGRKICDEQDTRTNIYSFGLAPSGGGKDRARQVNKEILKHAGGLSLLGQESFASQQGLFAQVESKRAVLCQVDELGEFMKGIKNPKNAHLHGIVAELLKLYSSSSTVYLGPAHADTTRDKAVEQPHLVFYGTTVSESFFDAMTIESITGGFLSRAFFFEGPDELQDIKTDVKKFPVPESIIKAVKEWIDYVPPNAGNMSQENPKPFPLTITTKAMKVFRDANKYCDERHNLLKFPLGTIWTRVVENARKLAILHACSADGIAVAEVAHESARWAVNLAKNRAERMEYLASTRVSENDFDRDRLRLLRIIENTGGAGATKTELTRKARGIKPEDQIKLLNAMILAGDIEKANQKTGGRQQETYRATLFSTFFPSGDGKKSECEKESKSA